MFDIKMPDTVFPGTYNFSEVANMRTAGSFKAMQLTERLVQPDDPFNIMFTSGTTGLSKAATLSSFAMINVAYFAGQRWFGMRPEDLYEVRRESYFSNFAYLCEGKIVYLTF
jgi:acyl-coenzyme A synthetase/AMP-(fatty) acid ligase